MKGVSEVIAIILILMIVIALAALAYTWFSGIFATMTGAAGTAVTTTTQAMATQFQLESAKESGTTITFFMRNTGTQTIDLSKVAVYSGDSPLVCSAGCASTLTAGMRSGATTATGAPACATCSGGTCMISGKPAMLRVTLGVGLETSTTIYC